MLNRLETDRLVVRRLTTEDEEFMLDLLNQPSFHRFIGDRGVTTLDQARTYIEERALAGYEKNGFGPYAVELKKDGSVIGIVSLLDRDELEDVDIGFAFLPGHWRQGYAYEATSAMMENAFAELGLDRIIAVTQVENTASIKTLEKMGLAYERVIRLDEHGPDLRLYAVNR
jgi:RimJ/RimL family protein N-acetyltransferase